MLVFQRDIGFTFKKKNEINFLLPSLKGKVQRLDNLKKQEFPMYKSFVNFASCNCTNILFSYKKWLNKFELL